jgi:hypothetical protein
VGKSGQANTGSYEAQRAHTRHLLVIWGGDEDQSGSQIRETHTRIGWQRAPRMAYSHLPTGCASRRSSHSSNGTSSCYAVPVSASPKPQQCVPGCLQALSSLPASPVCSGDCFMPVLPQSVLTHSHRLCFSLCTTLQAWCIVPLGGPVPSCGYTGLLQESSGHTACHMAASPAGRSPAQTAAGQESDAEWDVGAIHVSCRVMEACAQPWYSSSSAVPGEE